MLKEKERVYPFLVFETIPENAEIGKFLIELSLDNNIKNKQIFEDFGFKILAKTKSHLLIVDCLLKIGDIPRAMNYLRQKYSKFKSNEIKVIFKNNKNIIEKNKDLFLKYIN